MPLHYRLALDLGTTSLGWAMIRLNAQQQPCAIIKAGVRIFSDGRHPKTGASLAVARREARAMRRRRDRLLKRKTRMIHTLTEYGFWPTDTISRKALETLNPYQLRAKGLDSALTPAEFGRALFHINQRRGFKSNRKTDKKENDSGALKSAIKQLREKLDAEHCRTVGEWLCRRLINKQPVRARLREHTIVQSNGKTKIDKSYDLYIDRAMVEHEFDTLWQKQAQLNPVQFNEAARIALKDVLLYQRPLKPVVAGRCSFIPDEQRAALALPSVQRFRIYQEVNNLRLLQDGLKEQPLSLEQRNILVAELEKNSRVTFTKMKKLLGVGGAYHFNLEDDKRPELKGNLSNVALSREECFGKQWYQFNEATQDKIALQLLNEADEAKLIDWLIKHTGINEQQAETIANIGLTDGYASLGLTAISRILPHLEQNVITFDKSVLAAGFDHHSQLGTNQEIPNITEACEHIDTDTGEIKIFHRHKALPYYGEYLQRHVGFGTGNPEDTPEKRYGKIANPTVHIGLNQVRRVVNELITKYGHPCEVIIEVARDLKQNKAQRDEDSKRQADNQKRNQRMREDIAKTLGISAERVKRDDLEKMILWEELNRGNAADRHCPYSGVQISAQMLLSPEVEIEHILPFSQTLDDSLNNKTVSMRIANRVKGNRTPFEAKQDFATKNWSYEDILARAGNMPKEKRWRFAEDAMQHWLKDDQDFLARALNDTRHLSRVAREYLSLICRDTRVIPGRMTALLRAKFGLNGILGLDGEKNRNDHRHHAVDACVIGVTDQGMLQKFAQASASCREKQLNKLVETMPLPWDSYQAHVKRAVERIWVSHKPDHSFEGAMHNDTAYGLRQNGLVSVHKIIDSKRQRIEEKLSVIPMSYAKANARHGTNDDGSPKLYKGYKGDSNYCIEIVRNEKGKWEGEVISTFDAYQIVRQFGLTRLRHPHLSASGKPLVMRLMKDDIVRLHHDEQCEIVKICWIRTDGRMAFAAVHEANVDARDRNKTDPFNYLVKSPSVLQKMSTRKVTITATGELRDPGFKG